MTKNKKRDFYAYSKDIFLRDKNVYFKKNVNTFFGRFNEEKRLFKHEININNLKFRSEEDYIDNPNEEIYKIVVLGDSYVAGFDVLNYWVKELEKQLNINFKGNIKLYNLGLPGTGPVNWIEHKETINKINPDFLIIGMVKNILLRPLINIFIEDDLIITEYERKDLLYKGLLIDNLNTINKEEIKEYHNKYNKIIENEKIDFPILDFCFFNRNLEALEELINITNKSLIVQMPTYNTYDDLNFKDNVQYNSLLKLSNNKNIDFIHLRNHIDFAIDKEKIYIKSGDHFNTEGNKLVSNLIIEHIKNKNNDYFYNDIFEKDEN